MHRKYARLVREHRERTCAERGHDFAWPLWQKDRHNPCRRCGATPKRKRGRLVGGWQQTLDRGPGWPMRWKPRAR